MYPKLIQVGTFYIPTYGVLVALGFLAGLGMTLRLARQTEMPAEKITNLAVYCAMAGIIGAKLFMFLFDAREYLEHPSEIFSIETLRAAGVFHGGLIVALIVGALYMRSQQLPLWQTMDVFAPGIALGHAIGRIGCFAAGCCWGKECHLPWGVYFRSNEAAPVPLDRPLHPVQLYESAANLIIFAVLYRQFTRGHRPGQVIGLYLVLYSVARFVIEFFREHEQALWGRFSITQWIALALLALGTIILFRAKRSAVASQQTEPVRA
ncbi:MAG: prolipoprotein diacylglyceryl transferase [Acidobacteriaceae bacterium]|nr:prolipoprotein diacylglyceryl transferase [Acidobacteriaceae bacterium]MBV9779379.1 prolipoprotein diacylglyceryl transferase [Acidobacteriaceae bacterium]